MSDAVDNSGRQYIYYIRTFFVRFSIVTFVSPDISINSAASLELIVIGIKLLMVERSQQKLKIANFVFTNGSRKIHKIIAAAVNPSGCAVNILRWDNVVQIPYG